MSLPPLAGGDHAILSSEFCSGYTDVAGVWNTGFYCPQTGSNHAVYCCGTPTYKYCCTDKQANGTGSGVVELPPTVGVSEVFGSGSDVSAGGENAGGAGGGSIIGGEAPGNDYSGATRMRPLDENGDFNLSSSDLSSLNLSDVPIIFGVACGVAAVLILVILVGFYLTSCCAHYHQLHQNRKRRSSMTGIYRGATTANTSTTSGLVNLYSPTNSAGGTGGGGLNSIGTGMLSSDNPQTYIVHHHHHNPPASPDSCSTSADHFQMAGGSTSLVTTPLDIEWSSTAQYLQNPQQPVTSSSASQLQCQQQQHPQSLNFLSSAASNHIDNRIHYTVHQTQNRLAVALTGSMNRLSDRASPCPSTPSSYPVNIPLTPPDGYSYPRQIARGLSPPPQYSSSILARADSPPYYPSYDSSSSNTTDNLQQHNYLSRTSTLPISLTKKPPMGCNRPLLTSPGPYGSNLPMPQQPKSILRTSQNYRRVVTNETPPPIPSHSEAPAGFFSPIYLGSNNNSLEGALGTGGSGGNIAYRNVDSRTNLSSQPLLLLESNGQLTGTQSDNLGDDDDDELSETQLRQEQQPNVRRTSISTGINTNVTGAGVGVEVEEEDESRDQFDIHDIDSDALSRLIELDLDSKL